jgi:hypothetical protein
MPPHIEEGEVEKIDAIVREEMTEAKVPRQDVSPE